MPGECTCSMRTRASGKTCRMTAAVRRRCWANYGRNRRIAAIHSASIWSVQTRSTKAETPAEALGLPVPARSAAAEIAGHEGDEILVSIYRPAAATTQGPGILHLHGGGMVMGDRFTGVPDFLPYVASHGAVIVSVEYRLAPEYPDPYPVEDCYAALL